MPLTLDPVEGGRRSGIEVLSDKDYKYSYPHKLNLKPGSDTSNMIVRYVMDRARESYIHMDTRHKTWEKIDESLTAYISLDEKEKAIRSKDARRPVSIVVPLSYATLETLLAYWISAFLETPVFRYSGVGPEDTLGAILLEKVIEHQTIRAKMGLSLYTQARDAYAYGFGAGFVRWIKKSGFRRRPAPTGFWGQFSKAFIKTGMINEKIPVTLYEGNEIVNIDPYCYLPDVSVSIDRPQDGSYVGWIRRTNVPTLLSEEVETDIMFNCRYLQHVDGRSTILLKGNTSARERRYGSNDSSDFSVYSKACDLVYMYANVLPRDLGLHNGDYPEKWFFVIGADNIVLAAEPLDLDHQMYPVGVIAPGSDGYSTAPVSKVEIVSGLQKILDFLYNSHISNVRKALNDMLVVDPQRINMKDVQRNEEGKIIRLRKSAWGRGVKDAIEQLKVTDVTSQHLGEIPLIIDLANRFAGTVDPIQGVNRGGSERVSAREAGGIWQGAINKLMKDVRVCGMQGIYDYAYMLASHTVQFMSEPAYVEIVGDWEQVLREDFGYMDPKISVSPLDLSVAFDVVMRDAILPDEGGASVWTQLFGMVAGDPELRMTFDLPRIFKYIARLSGAKNVHEFIRNGGMMAAQVMPNEQVAEGAASGKLEAI